MLKTCLEGVLNTYSRPTNVCWVLTNYKNLKPKNPKTLLKNEPIMKNVDELYEKYYTAYKNDYDDDDQLCGPKRKKSTTKSLNGLIKQIKSQN